jgi:NTE family protein
MRSGADFAPSRDRADTASVGVRNYLVEGVSGTGKTSVCRELNRRGYHAVNGDRELAYQGDPETGEAIDSAMHEHHIWDVGRVQALVAEQQEPVTFFCGGSRNFSSFIDLFDGVFVLDVDLDTLHRRLDQRPGDEWGSKPSERDLVVRLHRTKEDIPSTGVVIDATPPLASVVDEILRHSGAERGQDAPSDGPTSDQDQPQVDATMRVGAAGERALVLGGGGSTGNAWLVGVIAGLFDAGLDVTPADLIIGTSAGATAAAQVVGAPPTELLDAILAAAPQPPTRHVGSDRGRAAIRPVADHLERTSRIIASAQDAADMRRRMGAAALETDAASDGSWQARWRAAVASRLPSQHWPPRAVLITAVDARTGEPVVFDRHSGVELADAVAASCASGLPYRIGDHQYIDGGYRRNENADLAAGYARVLVLSPFGGRTRHPLDWSMQLAAQVEELRARGSRVETIFPDSSSEDFFGASAMDVSLRPPAARAGHHQGRALAEQLTEFWR